MNSQQNASQATYRAQIAIKDERIISNQAEIPPKEMRSPESGGTLRKKNFLRCLHLSKFTF